MSKAVDIMAQCVGGVAGLILGLFWSCMLLALAVGGFILTFKLLFWLARNWPL